MPGVALSNICTSAFSFAWDSYSVIFKGKNSTAEYAGCEVAVLHLPRRLCAQKVCLQCVTDTVLWKKLYHFPPAVLDFQLPCTSFGKCIT